MDSKNLAPFREFIKQNYKFALIYSNKISQFAGDSFRGDAFKIKSDLAHNLNKDEYLYIPANIGRVITRIYKDYVIGLGYNVDFSSEELNDEFVRISDEIELQLKLDEGVNNQSSIGYWLLRLRKVNEGGKDKPRVEVIPLSNYVANMDGLSIGDDFRDIKEHFIFSVQKDKDDRTYFYVDRYEKLDNGKWKGYYGEEWSNNGTFVLSERIKEWEEEILDDLPLYLFNNDLDNPHIVGDEMVNDVKVLKGKNNVGVIPRFFHQSDYVDLADFLQELNDRGSQISVEFIKNLTSKLSVPAWFRDAQTMQALKNGNKGEFSKNPDYLVHNPGEEPARYITKDATYVQVSIKDYIPYLLKMIWFIASIPASLLGNAIYGDNNPVGTTQQERKPFIKRIESKQARMYSSLQRLFKGIMEIAGHTNAPLPTIKFNKPDNYDIAERTNTAIQQINAGIMSKESAIAYIMGYDATEVAEELEKIDEEEKQAYSKYTADKVDFEDENVDDKDDNLDEDVDGDDAEK